MISYIKIGISLLIQLESVLQVKPACGCLWCTQIMILWRVTSRTGSLLLWNIPNFTSKPNGNRLISIEYSL